MKKTVYILFTLILVFLMKTGQSQSIGIDSMGFNLGSLPDTININDNYNHTVRVQNKSATPFTGIIWLMAAVDTGTGVIDIDTVGFSNVTNFGLGDTTSITYNEIYSFANSYKLGGNIVVVWPEIGFGSAPDSLFKDLWILMGNNIDPTAQILDIPYPYPNPFQDKLYLQKPKQVDIKEMNLMNSIGQRIWTKSYSKEIQLGVLPKGMYILQLVTNNGKVINYKLLKE